MTPTIDPTAPNEGGVLGFFDRLVNSDLVNRAVDIVADKHIAGIKANATPPTQVDTTPVKSNKVLPNLFGSDVTNERVLIYGAMALVGVFTLVLVVKK